MKKIVFVSVIVLLFGTGGIVSAATVTFNFDASGPLSGSVFGFQINYALSDGSLLDSTDLTLYFSKRYDSTVPGIVPAGGAIPGADMTELGLGISTDWSVGVQNNASTGGSNAIVGYTLGTEPLLSGPVFSFTTPAGVSFEPSYFELSDSSGTPGAFVEGRDYFLSFDPGTGDLTVSAVPIPSTLLLLGGGLVGVFGLRRRVGKKSS